MVGITLGTGDMMYMSDCVWLHAWVHDWSICRCGCIYDVSVNMSVCVCRCGLHDVSVKVGVCRYGCMM